MFSMACKIERKEIWSLSFRYKFFIGKRQRLSKYFINHQVELSRKHYEVEVSLYSCRKYNLIWRHHSVVAENTQFNLLNSEFQRHYVLLQISIVLKRLLSSWLTVEAGVLKIRFKTHRVKQTKKFFIYNN